MKKSSAFAGLFAGILALLTFSCESLDGLVQAPTAEVKSVSIAGVDLDGISFNCNYAVKNPYGVSISLKNISMDVDCDNKKITSASTRNGLNLNAQSTTTNTATFKVPYTAILDLAKAFVSSKTLPFNIDGSITLDTSRIPAMAALGTTSLTLPIKTNFEVPVFKPTLSVANFKVKMPSFNEILNQLKGGLGLIKATQIATKLISGEKLTADILDGIAMDIDFTFDLNVGNEGAADWNFKINECAINTKTGSIADVGPVSQNTTVSSKKSTVPMKATLNTIEAGAFIIQLLNKSGENPTFSLSSGLTFPDTSYAKNIPLNYSVEIPLSSIAR